MEESDDDSGPTVAATSKSGMFTYSATLQPFLLHLIAKGETSHQNAQGNAPERPMCESVHYVQPRIVEPKP